MIRPAVSQLTSEFTWIVCKAPGLDRNFKLVQIRYMNSAKQFCVFFLFKSWDVAILLFTILKPYMKLCTVWNLHWKSHVSNGKEQMAMMVLIVGIQFTLSLFEIMINLIFKLNALTLWRIQMEKNTNKNRSRTRLSCAL